MQRPDKKSIVLSIISTLLIGVVSYFSIRVYAKSIFAHLQMPTSSWSIMGLLVCIPSILATIGMILRKPWSLILSAILSIYVAAMLTVFLIDNLSINALLSKNIVSLVIFIVVYLSLFFVLFFSSGIRSYFNCPSNFVGVTKYFHKYRFIFSISLILIVIIQFVCVKQYLYYQQFPWPPPDIYNQQIHKKWSFFVEGNISNSDIAQIVDLIDTLESVDKKIFSITQKENGTIIVETG